MTSAPKLPNQVLPSPKALPQLSPHRAAGRQGAADPSSRRNFFAEFGRFRTDVSDRTRPRSPPGPSATETPAGRARPAVPRAHSPFLGRLWITFTAASNRVACTEPVSAISPSRLSPPPAVLPPRRAVSADREQVSLPRRAARSTGRGREAPGRHPTAPRRQRVPGPAPLPSAPPAARCNTRRAAPRPGPASPCRASATPNAPVRPTAHPYLPPVVRRPCYVSHSSALPLPSHRPGAVRGSLGNVVRPLPAPGPGGTARQGTAPGWL